MADLFRFLAIVASDWRERVRSSRFWLTLAGTAGLTWLCFPSASANYIVLGINGHYRGLYSSAWISMVLAMLSIWTSLAGFYLVRGSLARDIDTRVWELLQVTTLRRSTYLAAKWCGNMVLLLSMLAVQFGVGVLAQMWRAEVAPLHPLAMLMPVLLIGLPTIAITAMFALWFDLLPPLRKGVGNFCYFLLWVAIPISMARSFDAVPLHGWLSDPYGVTIFQQLVQERLASQLTPPLSGCGICSLGTRALATFDWAPWSMPVPQVLGRAAWLMLALAGVWLAAPVLERFASRPTLAAAGRQRWRPRLPGSVTRLLRSSRFGLLFDAELQLACHGRNLWWWGAVAACLVAQVLADLPQAAYAALAAWVLLSPVVAALPMRELETGAGPLLYSAPQAARRLLPARWLAAVVLPVAVMLPLLLRFALAAPLVVLSALVAALSIGTWALALGAASRSARLAELAIFVFAYLGLQGVPVLNVAVAPLSTLQLHMLALPVASLLAWLAWPRMVARALA